MQRTDVFLVIFGVDLGGLDACGSCDLQMLESNGGRALRFTDIPRNVLMVEATKTVEKPTKYLVSYIVSTPR